MSQQPLALPARLMHSQVAASQWGAAAKAADWHIDAGQLVQFDSSVLSLLLDLGRTAKQDQKNIQIKNAPPRLIQLATLYGVEGVIGLSAA
jgi:phospholipid transport system transporter-binding protein